MKKNIGQIIVFLFLTSFLIFAWRYSSPRKVSLPVSPKELQVPSQTEGSLPPETTKELLPKLRKRRSNPARILGLYDGTEGTSAKNNDILNFAEQALETLGLGVDYYDINRGLPGEKMMQKYRGIISWYRDSKMKGAREYGQWLSRQIKAGRRVIILGNFGAFQEASTGKWLRLDEVNIAFNALGLVYMATWTSNPRVLQVEYKDSDMVEYKHPLSLKETKHYFLFESLLPDNEEYLVVRRTDIPDSASPLVVSTPYGGMALSNYIYYVNPDTFQVQMRLNFLRFFEESLWGKPGKRLRQKVLIIWDKEDDLSRRYLNNIGWALDYAKIEYETLELKKVKDLLFLDMKGYSSLILALNRIWKMEESEATVPGLKRYVREGGSIIVFYEGYSESLAEIFGIKEYRGEYPRQVPGLKFIRPFFPGTEGLDLSGEETENTSLSLVPDKGVNLLAVSSEKMEGYPRGLPLFWEYGYGRGKTLFWNVDSLWEKSYRGFIVQSILMVQPTGVASLANVEVIFLDDTPLPMWNKVIKPIKGKGNLTDTDFYLKEWWPETLALSRKYGINYTAAVAFNYNGKVNPPYDNSQFHNGKDSSSQRLGQVIIKAGFEMGLHGYNHQSLLLSTPFVISKGWRTEENMVLALKSGKEEWEKDFPYPPFTYVAPSDAISPEGEKALHEVFPSIKVVSTIYNADEEETGKEFTMDPWNDNFFNIPRMSFGYVRTPDMMKEMLNGIGSFGVWTHFFHPDDVYNEERSQGKSWPELKEAINELFSFVRGNYPWLRNMSARDAYYELLRYGETPARYRLSEEKIEAEFPSGSKKPNFFVMRINNGKTVREVVNGKIIYKYPGQEYYILETNSSRAIIYLKKADSN